MSPVDIFRSATPSDPDALTEVEVTLLDLGDELEQLLSDYLEALDPSTLDPAGPGGASAAVLGMRLCYRARYDDAADTGDHWVDSPKRSDPDVGVFRKIARAEREALPVMFIDTGTPLQVRAEGTFRALAESVDPTALGDALRELDADVHGATSAFSSAPVVVAALNEVLDAGASTLTGVTAASAIEFTPDDGSLAGLLRALQPAFDLGGTGPLPIDSHGSTARAVFAFAEAIAAARRRTGQLVIVADDFGEGIDSAACEHMAYLLHAAASQVLVTTRRSEVVMAFDPEEVVRLTRSHGCRMHHRLSATDKKGRVNRRLILDQLLAALTSETVVLLEGPFDADGYGALAARIAKKSGQPEHSLPGHATRLVAAKGGDGGITRLNDFAQLARELGFHVRAVVDSDKPGESEQLINDLLAVCEQVVVLPTRTAVEAALIRGVSGASLRKSVESLCDLGFPDIPANVGDDELAEHLISTKVLKKQGLHVPWVYALEEQPPIARAVIEAICSESAGRVDIADAP
ncbi:hypothetical protein GCM10028784_16810 [Myceligenerans cantabricum]